MSTVSIVGVPSSAGSYAAGQDQAPAALRSAGLIGALGAVGLEAHDEGDLPLQVWRPDRLSPRAQNVDQVSECVGNLIARLVPLLSGDQTLLVLGGNCTIALVWSPLCVVSLRIQLDCCTSIDTMTSTRPRVRLTERLTGWEWLTPWTFQDASMCSRTCSVPDHSLNPIKLRG